MELLVMILAPLPLGYLVRSRTAAFLAYVGLHSFVFTFQTMALTRQWVGGDTSAFARDPDAMPWAYGLVNVAVYGVGLGLVVLGHRLAARRRDRSGGGRSPVDLAA